MAKETSYKKEQQSQRKTSEEKLGQLRKTQEVKKDETSESETRRILSTVQKWIWNNIDPDEAKNLIGALGNPWKSSRTGLSPEDIKHVEE